MQLTFWTFDLLNLYLLFHGGAIPFAFYVSRIWLELPDLELLKGKLQSVMSQSGSLFSSMKASSQFRYYLSTSYGDNHAFFLFV